MRVEGNFKFFLDGRELKDFDEFEKKTKNIEVNILVKELEIYATSKGN